MLVGLVAVSLWFDIPFYKGSGNQPDRWLYLVWFFYYVVPWVTAFFLGFVLRPFWPRFRNLLVAILVIQGIYSVSVYALRCVYREKRKEVFHEARMSQFKTLGFRPRFYDRNHDGIIDDVELLIRCQMSGYPLGTYLLQASVTQQGRIFPDSGIGSFPVTLGDDKPKMFTAKFRFDPRVFEPYFESGTFTADLSIQAMAKVDADGARLMAFGRWSPFLRSTSWRGDRDAEISEQIIDLEDVPDVGSFWILPLDFARPQVVFKRFINDFGRDLDGDGLFDQLVIAVELSSKYEGLIFVRAQLQDAPYPIYHESSLKIGDNTLEFVLESQALRQTGMDGPYAISDIQIFNKNPGCHTDECLKKIKPFFTLYLDDYLTQRYSLTQFDP